MNQKDKELLLKDLSARLPYGVKVRYKSVEGEGDIKLGYGNIGYVPELGRGWWIECKPYLRPMSSMTEEEYKEYSKLWDLQDEFSTDADIRFKTDVIDWLNARHFDYRGLIERGLAIEVAKENNPYKE
jgi:hypothetical protein